MAAILVVQISNILYKYNILWISKWLKCLYLCHNVWKIHNDGFQWISVQNGVRLFQNGRNSVIKFKNNLDLK